MGAIHESSRAAIPYPHNVTSAICIPDGQNKERQKMYTGIDIGGTKCAVVLSDDNGNILKKERFPTVGFEETLAKIIDTTESAFLSASATTPTPVRLPNGSSAREKARRT